MRVLFIARNFPPQKGGLERLSFQLYSYLKDKVDIILIKWGGSKRLLVFILPYILLKSFWVLFTKKIDIIYLNEGFSSVLGIILKIFRIPIIITINGLDIVYRNKFYQFIIPKCITRLDRIICISQSVRKECIKRKIPEEKISLIPCGIKDEFYLNNDREFLKKKFFERFKVNIKDKRIILSVGRLIKRKGIDWFVENVIPYIIEKNKKFIYLIVGDGKMRNRIEEIVKERSLEDYVKFLGQIDDEDLRLVYNISDIFIMPNIPLEGDIEGFGLVILEASSCMIPVICSDLEGIKDATIGGKVGILVPPLDKKAFGDKILKLLDEDELRYIIGEEARRLVLENFSWDRIGDRYLEVFKIQYG